MAETKESMAQYLISLADRLQNDPGYRGQDLIYDLQETIEEWENQFPEYD